MNRLIRDPMACVLLYPRARVTRTIHRRTIRTRRRVIMDFAVILILSNTLMAVLIYIVITKIWQD